MSRQKIIGWRRNGAPIWLIQGGAPTRLETIVARMAEIQTALTNLEQMPAPEGTDEEIQRTMADRTSATDDFLAEYDTLEAERAPLAEREERVARVRAAALDSGRREETTGPRSPEFMRTTDPFEPQHMESLKRSLWGEEAMNATLTVDRASAAIERGPHMNDAARQRLTELVELDNRHAPMIARHMLLTGSPQYHQEFRDYIKSRGSYIGESLRTAMSLTDAAGGYLVPFTLDPTIILTNAGIAGPLRSISTIKTITTDTWNGVTSAGVNAEWIGEGVQAADASPSFGQPTITPKKADAWVFGSYEVLADSGFASELGRLLADAKVRLEEAAFATANTGATIPRGVVAAVAAVTASIVTSATTNAFVVGDLYNVSDALRPRDASQASWIGNKKIFSLSRRFDTAGGSAFWANLGMGVPQQLLGQPIYECSTMTGVVSTGANIMLVGNFSEYYIVDRVGMSVIYEPMVKSTGNGRPTGQAGWFAFWRVGADVVDPDAFRLLQLNQVAAATALA